MTNTIALTLIAPLRAMRTQVQTRPNCSINGALVPVIAATLAVTAAHPAAAQTTRDFQLPAPTPSPTSTSAPQGPEDERAGVPIRPRVIRQPPNPTPAPTSTPTPAASVTATPTPTPAPAPAPAPIRNPDAAEPQTETSAPANPAPESNRTAIEPGTGAQIPLNEIAGPGFEGMVDTEIPPEEMSDPVGPDDWYAVESENDRPSGAQGTSGNSAISEATIGALAVRQNRLIAGLSIMLVLAGVLAFLVWRRRRVAAEPVGEDDGPSLARGVSRVIDRQMSTSVADIAEDREDNAPQPAQQPGPKPDVDTASRTDDEPAAPPVPEPLSANDERPDARIDLDLDIIGATRSLMMFTLDFRLEIANRSNRAVRDLAVSGKLSSAQRGGANAAPLAEGQPIGEIARLGPHQSRSITAQLQLPLSQVQPIRQGNKPLLIPLLHLTLEGKGCSARSHSYVIGSPSLAGSGRVHPLPLDGAPGGLSGLQAQLINSFDTGTRAETI